METENNRQNQYNQKLAFEKTSKIDKIWARFTKQLWYISPVSGMKIGHIDFKIIKMYSQSISVYFTIEFFQTFKDEVTPTSHKLFYI